MTDTISDILTTDPAYCTAAGIYAEHEAASKGLQHRANVARALGDLEGWLRFAREERALMPALHMTLMAQHDLAVAAVERWLGPAPRVALGEKP